jgi:protein-S-isoprenylcysteine O-methyltransferase Ste14
LSQSEIWKPLGLGIIVAGLLYSVWARLVLGSNWSSIVTVHSDHQLIQTGPYAYTRHPIYTGILAAAFGTVLADGEVRTLLGFICLFLAFHLKLLVEERFMRGRFGITYEAYEAKVKRLVPFIY